MVRDLAGRLDWRQRFQAAGGDPGRDLGDPAGLLAWAEDRGEILPHPRLAGALRLLPLVSLAVMAWSWFVQRNAAGLILALLLQMAVTGLYRRRSGDILASVGRRNAELVDEIFRGTNSRDRHEGAMAVLRSLHALGAAGMVSTHELELSRLETLEPAHFRNVHFQESWEGGAIRFDYRLRPGVSTTTNVIQLIRMAGLPDPPA